MSEVNGVQDGHGHDGWTWREDEAFQEFGGRTLLDPRSSGFSLVGGGGSHREGDGPERPNVIVYLEELDSGRHLHASFDPESARSFANSLLEWADDADAAEMDVETAIETERTEWRRYGGIG